VPDTDICNLGELASALAERMRSVEPRHGQALSCRASAPNQVVAAYRMVKPARTGGKARGIIMPPTHLRPSAPVSSVRRPLSQPASR
jgi:hypothetical protein